MADSLNNRRLSHRTTLKYQLTLKSEDDHSLFGTVKNISRNGMHVLTLNGKQAGDNIRLRIDLPELLQNIYGKTIDIVASWRWSQPVDNAAKSTFYMAGFEYDIDALPLDSRFFIEHVLEGIPDHLLDTESL